MGDIKYYIQLHWKTVSLLILGIFLCSITSSFTMPYVFHQWEADRSISALRVSAGVLAGIAGLTILAMLVTVRLKNKENRRNKILLLALAYVLLQMIAGVIWGAIGLLSYYKMGITYGSSQTIMDICIAVWQNLIRVFFIYLLLSWKNNFDWKKHIKDFRMSFLVAACLAAIPILLNVFENNMMIRIIGLIWTCLFIILFVIFFDMSMRGTAE